MERNDKCFCGSGKKYKKCHIHIQEKSKLADMYKANHLFDKACIENRVVSKCKSGCSKCCKDFFFVTENEFLMIFDKLQNSGIDINIYKEKAEQSMDVIKSRYPDIIIRLDSFMPSGTNELLQSDFFRDDMDPIDMPDCIFLDDAKKCSIYECRPSVCRMFGTTNVCHVIGNEQISLKECRDMFNTNTVIKGKKGSPIIKRPYPLFYWFSFFLKDPYYEAILLKGSKIKNLSESEYYDFNIK